MPRLCLHCDHTPPANQLGVCANCWTVRGVRKLYRRRRGWNPFWEMHLRALALKAAQNRELINNDETTDD
jgi:hypothetical protein